MSPYEVFFLSLLAVVTTALMAVLVSSRRAVSRAQHEFDQRQFDDGEHERKTRKMREELAWPISKKPTFSLSARQIARINIERHSRGKPMLNRAGFQNAISHPWDRWDVRQPDNSTDWINYLIMYEVFLADHTSRTSDLRTDGGGLIIDPNQPYNGGGGDFGGGGASGDWTDWRNKTADDIHAMGATPPASDPSPSYDSGYVSAPVSSDSSSSSSSSDSSSSSSSDSSSSYSSFDSGPSVSVDISN